MALSPMFLILFQKCFTVYYHYHPIFTLLFYCFRLQQSDKSGKQAVLPDFNPNELPSPNDTNRYQPSKILLNFNQIILL